MNVKKTENKKYIQLNFYISLNEYNDIKKFLSNHHNNNLSNYVYNLIDELSEDVIVNINSYSLKTDKKMCISMPRYTYNKLNHIVKNNNISKTYFLRNLILESLL